MTTKPMSMLLMMLAGWINKEQQSVSLHEPSRMPTYRISTFFCVLVKNLMQQNPPYPGDPF